METGDSGEIVVEPASLCPKLNRGKKIDGLDVSAHARDFFDCVKSRSATGGQCRGDAAFAHRLPRRRAWPGFCSANSIDPEKEAFIDDDEANSLTGPAILGRHKCLTQATAFVDRPGQGCGLTVALPTPRTAPPRSPARNNQRPREKKIGRNHLAPGDSLLTITAAAAWPLIRKRFSGGSKGQGSGEPLTECRHVAAHGPRNTRRSTQRGREGTLMKARSLHFVFGLGMMLAGSACASLARAQVVGILGSDVTTYFGSQADSYQMSNPTGLNPWTPVGNNPPSYYAAIPQLPGVPSPPAGNVTPSNVTPFAPTSSTSKL